MAKGAKVRLTPKHMEALLLGKELQIPLKPDITVLLLTLNEHSQYAGLMDIVDRMEKLGAKLGRGAQTYIKELIDDMIVDRKKDKGNGAESQDQSKHTRCRN